MPNSSATGQAARGEMAGLPLLQSLPNPVRIRLNLALYGRLWNSLVRYFFPVDLTLQKRVRGIGFI
jgi:hypothetical protein